MARKDEPKKPAKKILFSTDGGQEGLTGLCSYFLRLTTRRTLGEETFQVSYNNETSFLLSFLQRDIMAGIINANVVENLLWNIERTVSDVFIPLLNANCMGDKGSDQLVVKVKKELLPCLRSFTRYYI